MSNALPGQHYCQAHQGNHSHYAEHNCTVCELVEALKLMLVDTPTLSPAFKAKRLKIIQRAIDKAAAP